MGRCWQRRDGGWGGGGAAEASKSLQGASLQAGCNSVVGSTYVLVNRQLNFVPSPEACFLLRSIHRGVRVFVRMYVHQSDAKRYRFLVCSLASAVVPLLLLGAVVPQQISALCDIFRGTCGAGLSAHIW